MKNFKRVIVLISILIISFSFAACEREHEVKYIGTHLLLCSDCFKEGSEFGSGRCVDFFCKLETYEGITRIEIYENQTFLFYAWQEEFTIDGIPCQFDEITVAGTWEWIEDRIQFSTEANITIKHNGYYGYHVTRIVDDFTLSYQ